MTLAADLFYDAPSNARATIDCFNHEQRYLLTEDQAEAFLDAARPHTESDVGSRAPDLVRTDHVLRRRDAFVLSVW
jgi:hypothetical protein